MTFDQLAPNVIASVVAGVLVAGLAASAAAGWRWRLLRKYGLSSESQRVLEALWDENLLRRSPQIARELNLDEPAVSTALEDLQKRHLVRQRTRANGKFWKITLRGTEYLRQRSWIE